MRNLFNRVIDWFFLAVVEKTSSELPELKAKVPFGAPITLIKPD